MQAQRNFQRILAVAAWFTVILQFVNNPHQNVIRFFSYFTILSNLLIALGMTAAAFRLRSRIASLLAGYSGQSALALYIIVVGLIYNLFLRGEGQMAFRDLLADTLAHGAIPILYCLYWITCIPAGVLQWRDALRWVAFPLLYLLYSLIRGSIVHWYPYYFIDLNSLSAAAVLLNSFLIAAMMLLIGLGLVALNRCR